MRTFPIVRVVLVTCLFTAAFGLGGCSLFHKKKADPLETLPVEQLYQQGKEAMDNHNLGRAAKAFQRLTARFPFGPYSEQAQLNLAYVQYKDHKSEEAYSAINRFIKTYPSQKHIDYAFYLRGVINFEREAGFMERYLGQDMTKRDQAFLRQSFDDFSELIKRYPYSQYTEDARLRMVYLRNTMAQSELNVAMYYLKRSAYVAAANRAKTVVETYPRTPQEGNALAVMVVSYRKLGEMNQADDAERVLKLNYPDHPFFKGDWPQWRSTWWKLLPLTNRG